MGCYDYVALYNTVFSKPSLTLQEIKTLNFVIDMRSKTSSSFVFLCLFICALHLTSPVFAENDVSFARDTLIVINPFPETNPGYIPHAPGIVPISASYESLLGAVILTFASNLGEIEVEVMNTTTGGYDSGTIDTQFLYATVPITMGSGHYLILFTLPSGQRYKGELDI
jgi:hypothetical protein